MYVNSKNVGLDSSLTQSVPAQTISGENSKAPRMWGAIIFSYLNQLMSSPALPSIFESIGWEQGDQIGRIFACWEIVYFGSCLKSIFFGGGATLYHYYSFVSIMTKKLVWLHFRPFFTNSSGHSGREDKKDSP
jgi:hypothetical protein